MSNPTPEPVFSSTRQGSRASTFGNRAPLLGDILVKSGQVSNDDLGNALIRQDLGQARLGEILHARNLISEQDLARALSRQYDVDMIDLTTAPPDEALMEGVEPDFCIKNQFIPWRQQGNKTIVACADPARFAQINAHLGDFFGPVSFVVAARSDVEEQIGRIARPRMSERANSICPSQYSCRSWARPLGWPTIGAGFALIAAGATFFPRVAMWLMFLWILASLISLTLLRLSALMVQIRGRFAPKIDEVTPAPGKLPVVSILVPLHGEDAILPALIQRLSTTDYPSELLDICLVLEASDTRTRNALAKIILPPWFRPIIVPTSTLQTKPRAMNYALGFCKGTVIGIYDAEDAPDRDQIHRIVELFAKSGPDVACIQGYLDFYNARRNWLARCFTIEYAIWFRVVMHGIEKLKLPIPLGGTTVFFRREAIEALGAWDAHNVTEDADLGFRLARLGYRCAFLSTTTHEEANCRLVPWVRQRSRWLKGYAMTWITHMRNPVALWRDLGARRFFAFQILMLGTLTGFLLAPFIWSLWLISFGIIPGYVTLLPWICWVLLGSSFVFAETVLLFTGIYAVSGREHRHLIPWVFTMIFYWPLATIAAYKAIFELMVMPFYWDKTSHGHLSDTPVTALVEPAE